MKLTKANSGFLALLGAAVVLTAACSPANPGNATAAPSSVSGGAPTSNSSNEPIFAGLEACDLLSTAIAGKEFDPPAKETYQSDNGCGAQKPRYGFITTYLVDKAGISDLKAEQGTLKQISIGNRDAVEIAGDGGDGNCVIGIAVTSAARATVGLSLSSGTNEQACSDAKAIAEQIAPKLPRGN